LSIFFYLRRESTFFLKRLKIGVPFIKITGMKQLYISLLLLITVAIMVSCSKKSELVAAPSKPSPPPSVVTTPGTPPTASFKINNTFNNTPGSVLEGATLVFENTSTNADTYVWDFGDGNTSADKTPANFSFYMCSMTYMVSLTAMNKSGQSSTAVVPYFVVCSRGVGAGAGPHHRH
jgi:hypothetical protein